MQSSPETSASNSELLLSAWFFLILHADRSTGGLPTEFLTVGAPSLLLFETVTCDRKSLDWEKPYGRRWVSSELWSALEKERILKPIDMQMIASQTVLPYLHQSGFAKATLEIMHSELDAIKKGRRPQQRLAIPAAIKELNKAIFAALGVERPNALLYPGRENYFKPSYRKVTHLPQVAEALGPQKGQRRFLSALKAIVPQFTLLPPVDPNSEAGAALRRSIEREKETVLRYAFGDPAVGPQEVLDFRLGKTFKVDDEKIDGPRRKIAEKNLKLLLRIRRDTSDVREMVSQIFKEVVSGNKTVSEFRRELQQAQKALASYLPSQNSVRFDLRLAKLAILAAVFECAAIAAGLHIYGAGSLSISAFEYFHRLSERVRVTQLRHKYPNAFFMNEVQRAIRKSG